MLLPREGGLNMDNGRYSFSQAQGYEEIPGPLKLEELPKDARTRIWNLFFGHLRKSKSTDFRGRPGRIRGDWVSVFRATHTDFDILPLDNWSTDFDLLCKISATGSNRCLSTRSSI